MRREITAQDEIESSASDVVEALLVTTYQGKGKTLTDVCDLVHVLTVNDVNRALGRLVQTGRLQAKQEPSIRVKGPKIVTNYYPLMGTVPQLFTDRNRPKNRK